MHSPLDLRKVKGKTQDEKLIDYLLLLRFGPKDSATMT